MKAYNKGVKFAENSPIAASEGRGGRFKSANRDNSLILPSKGGKQLHLSTINENITNLTNSV